jgi:hypothetical protein
MKASHTPDVREQILDVLNFRQFNVSISTYYVDQIFQYLPVLFTRSI